MKGLLVFTAAIAAAIAVTQPPRHAADATGDPTGAINTTSTNLFEADSNNDQKLHISRHETKDVGHDRSETIRKKHVPVRKEEANSTPHTPRKTVRHIGNLKIWNVDHQRSKVLRRGQKRYKRPMRRKTSLSWETDSKGQANNSHIHTSSAQFLTSQENTYKFRPENRSVSNSSLLQQGRSSTTEEEYRPMQKSLTRDSAGDTANSNVPDSDNVFEDTVSLNVRKLNNLLPVHTKDNQHHTLTDGISKQNEKQDDENHHAIKMMNALSEENINIPSNASAYNGYLDHVSDNQDDKVPAATVTNHPEAEWNLLQGESRNKKSLNETDNFATSLDTQRKITAYSLTASPKVHQGVRANSKANNTLSKPVVPKTVPPQKVQYKENYRLEEGNHTDGTVTPKGEPDNSQGNLFQNIAVQAKSTSHLSEAKNQEAAHGNTTTHKLRHERKRRVLGRPQANTSRHPNLVSENRNNSQATYNVYNFFGPVIITNGAVLPLNSNDTSPSKESGALNTISNILSNQASNEAQILNYSSSALNGMTMVFLPTRLASRLLLQSYNLESDNSFVQEKKSHGSNTMSVGSLHNVPYNGPSSPPNYDYPPPGWGEITHQSPASFGTGVDEYNRGNVNVPGYSGNGHYFSGVDDKGFSTMASSNAPHNVGDAHPSSAMSHSGPWSPPYSGPTGQGLDKPGDQSSGNSGSTSNPHSVHIDSTGIVHDNIGNNTPFPGGRSDDAQGLSAGMSSDVLNIVLNGNHSNESSTGNTVNYGSSVTGYDGISANDNQTIGSSDYGSIVLPDAPGAGSSAAGGIPNQESHFGSVPGDTSFTGPGSQEERWKVRGRVGFEWNPEHSGNTDSGSFTSPPGNAWNDQWGNYGNYYDPTMGVQPHGWQAPPYPYWQYNNAHPPFGNQGYGGYSAGANSPGHFMPPPYNDNWRPPGRTGYMWIEGDIWRDQAHGAPDFSPPHDLQPTTYSSPGAAYPAGAAYSPGATRSGLPVSHSAASLVGGVSYGASRRAPSGHHSSRRPAYGNPYYRPRPVGSYNPNLAHTLG